MHDTAVHVQIAGGGLTRSHSFVAIVSLRTEFVPRSSWTNQNAHIAIVVFLPSLAHAITYVIRDVSAAEQHGACDTP